jgi:hypothetical protein
VAEASGPAPLYKERREPQGELETPGGSEGADLVFAPMIDDALPPLGSHRHTIDVRVAQLDLRSPVDFAAPGLTSARVSQYPFGITATSDVQTRDVLMPPAPEAAPVQPAQPASSRRERPFVGDYIDIAGLDLPSVSVWRFNTEGRPW